MNTNTILKIVMLCVVCAATMMSGCVSIDVETPVDRYEDFMESEEYQAYLDLQRIETADGESLVIITSATPKETESKTEFQIGEKRNFTGVDFEFMGHDFEMEGWISWDGDMYTVRCDGWSFWKDHGDVYCFVIADENEGVIGINHGYGSTNFDQKLQYRLKKAILKKV